jgi:Carboxypeptidase regulatory-like domain
MRVQLSSSQMQMPLGDAAHVSVAVYNDTDVIAGYRVTLLGADRSWVTVEGNGVAVFPAETANIEVTLRLPDDFPAGHRQMALQVQALEDVEDVQTVALDVVVPRRDDLKVRVEPTSITAGRSASFGLLVENRGNAIIDTGFTGTDEEAAVELEFSPASLRLEPGESEIIRAESRGGRRWFGMPTPRVLTFTATGVDPATEVVATFVQKPRIGRWVLSLAGLIAAVSVFAVVITQSFEKVAESEKKGRQLIEAALDDDPTGANGIATNPGSVSGNITGPSDNAGLAGVTIELFEADDPDAVVAAVSTSDDGSFLLPGLNAGSYKLRVAGAGYAPRWFGGEGHGDATIITVQLGETEKNIDVSLEGRPGSVLGTVIADDPSGASAILVVTADSTGSRVPAEVDRVEVDPEGVFSFLDVPSPAVYSLLIEKVGFTAEPRVVRLGGGETAQGIEVLLREGNGSISGEVIGPIGPLDNVFIEVSDGVTTRNTVTLSTGDVGSFALRDLPTPGSYTLTFSRAGFRTESVSVVLGDVIEVDGVSVRLNRALGSIAGTVRDSSGAALGGARVTVTGGGESRTTTTLTTGALGAYLVDQLPIPATYTVTVTAPGSVSETRAVDLDEAPSTPDAIGVDVVLGSANASIGGTVSADGGPVSGVTVTITDGSLTLVTTSADDPLGAYHVDGIPSGVYTITYERPGSATASRIVSLSPGDAADEDVALAPRASISGTIFDLVGVDLIPRNGAVVQLHLVDSFPGTPAIATVTTGADGVYVFPGLDAPNSYVIAVQASAINDTLVASTVVPLVPGQQIVDADVTVE